MTKIEKIEYLLYSYGVTGCTPDGKKLTEPQLLEQISYIIAGVEQINWDEVDA